MLRPAPRAHGCRCAGTSIFCKTSSQIACSSRAAPVRHCNGCCRKAHVSKSIGSSLSRIWRRAWGYKVWACKVWTCKLRPRLAFSAVARPATTITSTLRSGVERSLSHRDVVDEARAADLRGDEQPQRTIGGALDLAERGGIARLEIIELEARLFDLGAAIVEHA